MPWAGLDDGFHDDPRTLEVGLEGAGLYACATTYCARHLTDGVIPHKALERMLDGGDRKPLDALLRIGLLHPDDTGDGYVIADYFKGNKPRQEVEKHRAAAKERAKKAARARWSNAHRPKEARPDWVPSDTTDQDDMDL